MVLGLMENRFDGTQTEKIVKKNKKSKKKKKFHS